MPQNNFELFHDEYYTMDMIDNFIRRLIKWCFLKTLKKAWQNYNTFCVDLA